MTTISGGEKLEKTLNEIARKLGKGGGVNIGFLEGATYPDGTSVAMVAAIQNFGAPARGIPPRPFFSNMVKEKSPEWGDQFAAVLEANDYDLEKSLAYMGEGIKGQLQQAIIDTDSPALSILTLMARKWKADHPNEKISGSVIGYLAAQLKSGPPNVAGVSTKVLVDTGVMLQSIDYEVKT